MNFCMQIANDSDKVEMSKIKNSTDNWSTNLGSIIMACLFIGGTFFVKGGKFHFRLMCSRLFIHNVLCYVHYLPECSEVGVLNHTRSSPMHAEIQRKVRTIINLSHNDLCVQCWHTEFMAVFIFSFDWILSLHRFVSLFRFLWSSIYGLKRLSSGRQLMPR